LLLIPGTLRLVEDDDMLMRRCLRRPTKTLLEKVIDVLDSCAHLATDNPQRFSLSSSAAPQIFVSRQGLSKHYDQRCITREIDNITITLDASCYCTMNNVEARESLPRTRYARQEH
jgi:hypothetical protein